ncbi:hypothetical protein DV735_g2890, partial [Chaetothyriales sp. CBS 134920]
MVVDDGAKKTPLVSLIAGGAAGGVECTITYPFEFAKTRVQLRDDGAGTGKPPTAATTTRNPFAVISKVIKDEGPRALYKGCETLIVGTIAKDAIRFISFDTIKERFKDPETGTLSPLRNLGAGISSGIVSSTLAVTPSERIKTALIDDARREKRFKGAWDATRQLVREHGLADLYRGYVTTTMKQASTTASTVKDWERVRNIAQTTPVTFANGAVAGVVVVFATQPFDTLKTRAQSVQGARVIEAFNSVITDYGFRGLWRGSTMRLGRTVLAGGILFTSYEWIAMSARRLKKREIDRRCQRQARERTKSRIAYLEGLVESLRQSDGDDRSVALLKRIDDTEKERDALAQALRDVQKAISGYRPVDGKVEPGDNSPLLKYIQQAPPDTPPPPPHRYAITSTPYSHPGNMSSAMTAPQAMPMPTTTPPIPTGSLATNAARLPARAPALPVSASHIAPTGAVLGSSPESAVAAPCQNTCDCCWDDPEKPASPAAYSHWQYSCNTLLGVVQSPGASTTPENDLLAEDIPVRVVLEGWDAVEQQVGLPMSWDALRKIDKRIFDGCTQVTRLAVLVIMHILLRYHSDPSPERYAKIPSWYLARPSTQSLQHSYAVNYIPWPGMRERFVFFQHSYCSNFFWKLMPSNVSVNWPYDLRDCFIQRWDSGTFEISPLFRECITNINNWQLGLEVFERYPELRADVPLLQSANSRSSLLPIAKMSGFSGMMKGGWHPKGKEGGRESWRGDFKGISQVAGWVGKARGAEEAGPAAHISRPLTTLKDPASFGPPPKNINYHGPAALPTEITPTRVGLGAPLSQEEIEAANAQARPAPVQAQEYEEEGKRAGPALPYRSDRTGLSTSNLPPPPVHPAISHSKPGLPPRLPARQNSTGLGSPPPPAYDTVVSQPSQPAQSDAANGILNASAINRLGNAGVSVPALGIGKTATPSNGPSNPGTREPSRSCQPGSAPAGAASTFSELSSRFAARNNSSSAITTAEQTAPQAEERPNATPTWQQSQGALRTASNFRKDPSSISMADAREAAQTTSSAARAANTFREKHADTFAAAGRRANAFDQKYKT